jgi:hypothetical protein
MTEQGSLRPRATWTTAILVLLVLIPIGFDAVLLWPEVAVPVPSVNDNALHYTLIQRASEALSSGENPLDHWAPELEIGFPWFLYYQNVPHLTVVLLHRLLLGQVDLLTLFNALRYVLLVGFPLVVYWSMRRMDFSAVAAAGGAVAATLLSTDGRYGFDYASYVWLGFGMYTQLWAMLLSFVALACVERVVEQGKGYVAAIAALTTLVLCHLIYAYMMAIAALLLMLTGVCRANVGRRVARMAVMGGLVAVITAYMFVPFLFGQAYLNVSPYLPRLKFDSYGAQDILTALANGDLLDFGRLPVLTALLALGLAAALFARERPARVALVLFVSWLLLYFGRPTWGRLIDLLPLHEGLMLHRFSGWVHLAAILLIGLGTEWAWRVLAPLGARWRPVALALLILVLLVPALRERRTYYSANAQAMERSWRAVAGDADAETILAALRALPPGRTHAGLQANWGGELRIADLRFYNLLTFHRIESTSPPFWSVSLNADLMWHFDDHNPVHYELFGVKYLVAPRGWAAPDFVRPLRITPRYVLYEAPARGYAGFAAVTERASPSSQASLFQRNLAWFVSEKPAAGQFVRYDFPPGRRVEPDAPADGAAERPAQGGCPDGRIVEERVGPGRITLVAECPVPTTLVLKVTYHPNWRVLVDGAEAHAFMISPSFIGVALLAGRHEVRAEYRSAPYRMALLAVGLLTFAGVLIAGHRLEQLPALAPRPSVRIGSLPDSG